MRPVVERAHALSIPVMFPCVVPKSEANLGTFGRINPMAGDVDQRGYEFIPEVGPQDGDLVIPKERSERFLRYAIGRLLVDRRIDTVIVMGCTTSGCVRATTVDAFSYNFRRSSSAMPRIDRAELSHQISLFELAAKYADVASSADVLAALGTWPVIERG